jgi:hypothetical protein
MGGRPLLGREGGAAVDLEGGVPPGARASTAAFRSLDAAARHGRPRGGGGRARRGLGREEQPARTPPRCSTAASDPIGVLDRQPTKGSTRGR